MKKITKELVNKSVEELKKEAQVIRQDIAKRTVERKVKPDKNSNTIKILKKRLAVVLTIAHQKELSKEIK
ncbi:hypothetical protein CO051_05000 [Candidatus Roizmanbacteria bacterium CG_4_9_14_0_2_um_filter_39_13]|uniref:Large ribosomal subunit protein uL29 n=2 Tax=Candidatus Roizmaniibacteriota TaxID=1752723 RepID=A0A2M8EXK7_9BACT|nr:MAG: hypothetical protein COY15_04015 [Candidatus Roizmanbacteria bacterium CG_4_10_14_0_2_um_filter_39_12]PJC30753.1 MAG: hypothetical protein CO051_05000 [Candidatus Roizmanbacteria bacterium CG_4_9_14_0_2_um_filter_39_13]PJE62272.1 MAG: hypothetical protein COU87_00100 [Candidatus Roizmanbacteria bacterium CG10_big_fil_rev_8_21_14_0_10_39_12]